MPAARRKRALATALAFDGDWVTGECGNRNPTSIQLSHFARNHHAENEGGGGETSETGETCYPYVSPVAEIKAKQREQRDGGPVLRAKAKGGLPGKLHKRASKLAGPR